MQAISRLFELHTLAAATPFFIAVALLLILIISFRSRAVVFCQYLRAMTGVSLEPNDVSRVFREKGQQGVRELFLDLIIKEDLKDGPIDIPDDRQASDDEPTARKVHDREAHEVAARHSL